MHSRQVGATYASFLTHCNHKHINWGEILGWRLNFTHSNSPEQDHGALGSEGQPDTQEAMNLQQFDHSKDHNLCSNELVVSNEEVELTAAQFSFMLKYRLTQALLNFALESISDIINLTSWSIEHAVHQELSERDISPSPSCFHTPDPFSYLKTEYQQTKFYRDHFSLIVRNNPILLGIW